jgi:hypothetical protein
MCDCIQPKRNDGYSTNAASQEKDSPFVPEYDYPSDFSCTAASNQAPIDLVKLDSSSSSRWGWAEREAAALGSLPAAPQEHRDNGDQWASGGADHTVPRTPEPSAAIGSTGKMLIRKTARRLSHLAELYPIATSLRTPARIARVDANSSFQAVTPIGSEADSVESISPLAPQLRLRDPSSGNSFRMSSSTLSPLHKKTPLPGESLTENIHATNRDGDAQYPYAVTPLKVESLLSRRGENGAVELPARSPAMTQRSPFVSSFRSVRVC